MPATLLALILTVLVTGDETPPRLSAEANRVASELRESRPGRSSELRKSSKLTSALSSVSSAPKGIRIRVADTNEEAFYLGKVVSTLSWYAERKDAKSVKDRLATVRKMVDKEDTIAMVDFLSKGATPDVVGSTAYQGLIENLTAVVQVELEGRKRQYAGLYRIGLEALYLPLSAPLSAGELKRYSTSFQITAKVFGPYSGPLGTILNQLQSPNEEKMLEAMSALEQLLSK